MLIKELNENIQRRFDSGKVWLRVLGIRSMQDEDFMFIRALWTKQFYEARVMELEQVLDGIEGQNYDNGKRGDGDAS